MLTWQTRYSDTMEDDNKGRWARVAYAGDHKKALIDGKICYWEIAWITKLIDKGKLYFAVHYMFPATIQNHLFDTLEHAKMEVEDSFKWFLKCVK